MGIIQAGNNVQAEQLVGYKITKVIREDGEDGPVFSLKLENGTKKENIYLWSSRDEEQNGPGEMFASGELVI